MILSCSYASLWYGFAKGYEYQLGSNLADSAFTINSINLIREGKTEEAIDSLERTLDTQILERALVDTKFVKYIVGLTESDQKAVGILEKRIIDHRKSTNYKCTNGKEVCETINDFINNKK